MNYKSEQIAEIGIDEDVLYFATHAMEECARLPLDKKILDQLEWELAEENELTWSGIDEDGVQYKDYAELLLTKEDYVDLLNMHVQDMIIELNEKYDMQWYRFERPNFIRFKYRKSVGERHAHVPKSVWDVFPVDPLDMEKEDEAILFWLTIQHNSNK